MNSNFYSEEDNKLILASSNDLFPAIQLGRTEKAIASQRGRLHVQGRKSVPHVALSQTERQDFQTVYGNPPASVNNARKSAKLWRAFSKQEDELLLNFSTNVVYLIFKDLYDAPRSKGSLGARRKRLIDAGATASASASDHMSEKKAKKLLRTTYGWKPGMNFKIENGALSFSPKTPRVKQTTTAPVVNAAQTAATKKVKAPVYIKKTNAQNFSKLMAGTPEVTPTQDTGKVAAVKANVIQSVQNYTPKYAMENGQIVQLPALPTGLEYVFSSNGVVTVVSTSN